MGVSGGPAPQARERTGALRPLAGGIALAARSGPAAAARRHERSLRRAAAWPSTITSKASVLMPWVSRRIRATTGRDVLDLADDCRAWQPSSPPFGSTSRTRWGQRPSTCWQRTLVGMSQEWIDGTLALLDGEGAMGSQPNLQTGNQRPWNEIADQAGRAATAPASARKPAGSADRCGSAGHIQSAAAGRQSDTAYRSDSGDDPYQR